MQNSKAAFFLTFRQIPDNSDKPVTALMIERLDSPFHPSFFKKPLTSPRPHTDQSKDRSHVDEDGAPPTMTTPALTAITLRQLDACLKDRGELETLKNAVDKIQKICTALDRGINLADILHDEKTLSSLKQTFGEDDFNVVLQTLTRLSLENFTTRSFTTRRAIEGKKKIEFIHRSLGGWKQFNTVISIQLASPTVHPVIVFLNPSKPEHFRDLETIPAGSLVSVNLIQAGAGSGAKRSLNQEYLATERVEAIFDTIQDRTEGFESQAAPVIQMGRQSVSNGTNGQAKGHASGTALKKKAQAPKLKSTSSTSAYWKKSGHGANPTPTGTPVQNLKVTVNKMDTFVHAGNAQLILGHLRDYSGRVLFFVLRGEKKAVQLDADSMWGAEIRNGETVLFEFYGPMPTEDFLKELAKKVNKYTQMDKVANE